MYEKLSLLAREVERFTPRLLDVGNVPDVEERSFSLLFEDLQKRQSSGYFTLFGITSTDGVHEYL